MLTLLFAILSLLLSIPVLIGSIHIIEKLFVTVLKKDILLARLTKKLRSNNFKPFAYIWTIGTLTVLAFIVYGMIYGASDKQVKTKNPEHKFNKELKSWQDYKRRNRIRHNDPISPLFHF